MIQRVAYLDAFFLHQTDREHDTDGDAHDHKILPVYAEFGKLIGVQHRKRESRKDHLEHPDACPQTVRTEKQLADHHQNSGSQNAQTAEYDTLGIDVQQRSGPFGKRRQQVTAVDQREMV